MVVGWTAPCKFGAQILDADEAAVQLRVAGSTLQHAGRAAGARKVGVVSHRQALSLPRGRTMENERFVAESTLPLMEPPDSRLEQCFDQLGIGKLDWSLPSTPHASSLSMRCTLK